MPAVLEGIRDLVASVDAVCVADPTRLADGETVQELYRQLGRLSAAAARATAAFDAGRSFEADGAKTAAAWVSVRCHVPITTARRRVQLGRALRHMPAVEEAWLAGDIGEAHATLFARARTPEAAATFERDEAMLVEHARTLRYDHFARTMAYWRQLADPEGTEKEAGAQREARRVHLSQTFGGTWILNGVLDPVSGTIVAKALKRIEDELFEADWAEARSRVGDHARTSHLARTPGQRRADALAEMARRAGATPADARLPEPLFTVHVGYETFGGRICELADGTVVTPGSLVPWLDRAWVERVVYDGPDRIKNVGVRRRLFGGATRRAVEVRDRECFDEFCDIPSEECQIDHVQPYAAGGLTTDDNGRPACGYHNRRRAQRRGPPG